jgi:RNA polymerase sigma-70 factor (ECF subfamily)
MHEDSRDLVESASRGDASAIGALLERFLPQLHAFVRLQMGPELRAKEDSLDLVQSACREVLEHVDRFQYTGESNFRHWLFTTALRRVRNRVAYYRAVKRDAAREIGPSSDADASLLEACATFRTPSGELIAREELAALEAGFARLPEDYRQVVLLSRLVGLSHKEIAAAMDRTESATRNLLYRALAELAEGMRGSRG